MLFLAVSVSCFGQEEDKRGTIKIKKQKEVQQQDSIILIPSVSEPITIVEQMPMFPDGEKAMYDFINSKIVYPQSVKEKRISGTCFITFAVNMDGSISNIMILKNIPNCPEYTDEAIRIVKLMPKWNPGKQNGREVLVQYNLPVKFTVK